MPGRPCFMHILPAFLAVFIGCVSFPGLCTGTLSALLSKGLCRLGYIKSNVQDVRSGACMTPNDEDVLIDMGTSGYTCCNI